MNDECEIASPDGDMVPSWAWFDVACITVPAKTKRKTIIAKAVAESEALGTSATSGVAIRVLPAEYAEPINVEMEQPPPQLKIG